MVKNLLAVFIFSADTKTYKYVMSILVTQLFYCINKFIQIKKKKEISFINVTRAYFYIAKKINF